MMEAAARPNLRVIPGPFGGGRTLNGTEIRAGLATITDRGARTAIDRLFDPVGA